MGLLDFKYYVDFSPLITTQEFLCKYQNRTPLYTCHGGDQIDIWQKLDDETAVNSYNYSKYQRRAAICIELLIPNCAFSKCQEFAHLVIAELIGQSKLPAICYLVEKGKGKYLHIMVSERTYHEKMIEINTKFTGVRYRNRKTGQLCKATDPDAVVAVKKGDSKAKKMSHFSLKKRLFAFPKAEFLLFIQRIKRIVFIACQKINVQIQKVYFFKTIKHITIDRFYSRFVNRNIRAYNDAIHYMNEAISSLADAIWSPAKYYQDEELVRDFERLFHKYRQRLSKKSYSTQLINRKVKTSLSVFKRCDQFKNSIESFIEQFEFDLMSFSGKYITL